MTSTKPLKPLPERPQQGDSISITRDDSPYGYSVKVTGIWINGDLNRLMRLLQNAIRVEQVRIINHNRQVGVNDDRTN